MLLGMAVRGEPTSVWASFCHSKFPTTSRAKLTKGHKGAAVYTYDADMPPNGMQQMQQCQDAQHAQPCCWLLSL